MSKSTLSEDATLEPALADASEPTAPSPSAASAGPSGDPLPQICIVGKRVPEAVASAMIALAAYNVPARLFMYRGELIKVNLPCLANTIEVALAAVGVPELQCDLTYAARWFEQNGDAIKATYPPSVVVRDVLMRIATWAPPLAEVVRVPTFGAGWRLLDTAGYHSDDAVLYHPNHAPLAPISENPTSAEVAEARRLICDELLGDFPFRTPCDRTAAVAAAIVPFVRRMIEGATPLHLFESPQPGSGKTLLADAVTIPALGKEPSANTEIASGDDLRKWVTAMAMAGESVVLIDNINARLKGSALAAALTKVEWSDRILGTSKQTKTTMRWLWLATGNNVTMSSEMARRVVRSRIDPGMPRPYLRTGFRHADLRAWAKANRPSLIWAILTLVRHWIAQGRPDGQIVLGSYESYCRVIGGILQTAGITGFLANLQADCGHADDETIEWVAFVEAWHDRFGSKHVGSDTIDTEILGPNPEMLCTMMASTSSERGRRIKLGQELRKRRDAVLGIYRIRVSDGVDGHGCWNYWLELLNDPSVDYDED